MACLLNSKTLLKFETWQQVIHIVIYSFWSYSSQLVPAMVGIFAYKAAALVQVYRDNEELQFVFPENEEQ